MNVNNVMIDLETMGNKPGAPVIAIGAVYFDPKSGRMGDEFYKEISLESCVDAGCKMDASTVLWWLEQSDEARAKFAKNEQAGQLLDTLLEFNAFIKGNVKPWGNGASFDLGILAHCYRLFGIETPWSFWNERDVRTIVDLDNNNHKGKTVFDGIPHYALDDAKHQVKYVSAIIQSLK